MKIVKIITLLLIFQSCGSSINNVKYKSVEFENYYNVPLKKEIGEELIIVGTKFYQDAIKLEEFPNIEINTIKFPYMKGDILPLYSENKKWLFYGKKENVGVAVNKKYKDLSAPFINYGMNYSLRDIKGIKFTNVEYITSEVKNHHKDFIYNGKVGNYLKFIYREFYGEYARPSYYQDLQYDINDGNTIGFKGLRIEIINATNTQIEYKILKTFN